MCIDEDGAIRAVSALRWGNAGEKTFQYIPFGGEVHAERRFGDFVVPSYLSVGWWFDTPRSVGTDVARGLRAAMREQRETSDGDQAEHRHCAASRSRWEDQLEQRNGITEACLEWP